MEFLRQRKWRQRKTNESKIPFVKKKKTQKSTCYHFFSIPYLLVSSGLMDILIHWQKTQPCRVHSPGFRYAQILISSHTKVQNTFNTIERDLTCYLFSLTLYNQQSMSHFRGLVIITSHINGIMQCGPYLLYFTHHVLVHVSTPPAAPLGAK